MTIPVHWARIIPPGTPLSPASSFPSGHLWYRSEKSPSAQKAFKTELYLSGGKVMSGMQTQSAVYKSNSNFFYFGGETFQMIPMSRSGQLTTTPTVSLDEDAALLSIIIIVIITSYFHCLMFICGGDKGFSWRNKMCVFAQFGLTHTRAHTLSVINQLVCVCV